MMFMQSPSLPTVKPLGKVAPVTAKSVTRIRTRHISEEHSRSQRFFCARLQHTYQFMAGLEGLPSGRPVPFDAGSSNPSSLVAISRFEPWVTGSKIKGAYPMGTTTPVYPYACKKALGVALRSFARLRHNPPAEVRKPLQKAYLSAIAVISKKTGIPTGKVSRDVKRLQREFGYSLPIRADVKVYSRMGRVY